jgi:uncharacterized membrane protein
MIPDPLHPAVVHFPIVLMILYPLVLLVALLTIRRGAAARPVWATVLAVALLLVASTWVATRTGQQEEERVEDVVPENAIETHEEQAELFLWLTLGTSAVTALGLAGGRLGRGMRWAALAASLALLGAGWQVGHTGGELVYRYDAASVHTQSAQRVDGAGVATAGEGREQHEISDD